MDISPGGGQGHPQVNWRTCGRTREKGSLVARTRAWRDCPVPKAAKDKQEPSKSEQVHGFGSHVPRFSADLSGSGSALGPGAYPEPKAFHQEVKERVSWGSRGTGTFASKSRRFGLRNSAPNLLVTAGGPGPGSYNSPVALDALRRRRTFSKAKKSSSFAGPMLQSKGVPSNPKSASSPGPGEYQQTDSVSQNTERKRPNTAGITFRSRSERFAEAESRTPGPTHYNSAGTKEAPSSPTFHTSIRDSSDRVFKDKLQRHYVRVHPNVPCADAHAREALGPELADQVSREMGGSRAQSPGPGHYRVKRSLSAGFIGKVPTAAFLDNATRTEWVSGDHLVWPGPGEYTEEEEKRKMRPNSANASFASRAPQRGEMGTPDVPGPAFYSPQPSSRKNFHLNVTGAFMS
mmetsp:Transcript_62642/g.149419  ORF Transcript_62642/g.149419 Transcript_62642/m.149419 type:complete len:404 (-) Transcript_62642:160-1371(-)